MTPILHDSNSLQDLDLYRWNLIKQIAGNDCVVLNAHFKGDCQLIVKPDQKALIVDNYFEGTPNGGNFTRYIDDEWSPHE